MADDGYRDDIARREGKAERLKRLLIALTFLTSVIALCFLIWLVILIRDTQTANSPLVKQAVIQTDQIKALAQRIDSCVDQTTDDGDPVGECYEQAQRRTQDLVGEPAGPINTVVVLAIACADHAGVQTAAEITDCVRAELADRSR